MANNTFTDSDILKAMEYINDYSSIIYGANGHYANGAYYDLNKTYHESDETEAADKLKEGIDENLLKSLWLAH